MTADLRAVMVSDRGPLTFTDRCGQLEPQARPGSVTEIIATACRSAGGAFTWLATSSNPLDARALAERRFAQLRDSLGFGYEPLVFDERQYSEYYGQASVRVLWVAHHDLWAELGSSVTEQDVAAFTGAFTSVNQRFAHKIKDAIPVSVPVIFHDYQFALCPGMLRALGDRRPVAHFSHSAFGGPSSFKHLPEAIARSVIGGMLGADLLGFQSARWAQNFLDCCAAFLPAEVDFGCGAVHYREHTTWLRVKPAAIDRAALRSIAASPAARDWACRLGVDPARPRITRVDRLDPSKNILRGFAAFETLLATWPRSAPPPLFTACLIPSSRVSVPEYARYTAQVLAYPDRLNAKYPGNVRLFVGHDRERAFAALRDYDVLLVNSLADGLNLVAFEGALLNERAGVLVLSDRAGSSDYLGAHAVHIADPYDVAETTRALRIAMEMSPAQRTRQAAALRAAASERDPASWLMEQLADLDRISAGDSPATSWPRS